MLGNRLGSGSQRSRQKRALTIVTAGVTIKARDQVFQVRRHASALEGHPGQALREHSVRRTPEVAAIGDREQAKRSSGAARLEALKRDRAGQHSIRVNDQFRVCFRWTEAGADDVEIVDYH
jgi:toxin HigB-1